MKAAGSHWTRSRGRYGVGYAGIGLYVMSAFAANSPSIRRWQVKAVYSQSALQSQMTPLIRRRRCGQDVGISVCGGWVNWLFAKYPQWQCLSPAASCRPNGRRLELQCLEPAQASHREAADGARVVAQPSGRSHRRLHSLSERFPEQTSEHKRTSYKRRTVTAFVGTVITVSVIN